MYTQNGVTLTTPYTHIFAECTTQSVTTTAATTVGSIKSYRLTKRQRRRITMTRKALGADELLCVVIESNVCHHHRRRRLFDKTRQQHTEVAYAVVIMNGRTAVAQHHR